MSKDVDILLLVPCPSLQQPVVAPPNQNLGSAWCPRLPVYYYVTMRLSLIFFVGSWLALVGAAPQGAASSSKEHSAFEWASTFGQVFRFVWTSRF